LNHDATVLGAQIGEPKDAGLSRRAWNMVWMCMLGTGACSTAVVLINVGVFMKPLVDAEGWSRGGVAMALSIAALSMAAANPFVGRAIDRFGVRPVLITSLLGFGLATAALPFFVQIGGLVGFYIAYALIAALGAGSNVIAYVRVLSGWFSGPMNNSRGLALGISSAGLPLGAAASGPIGVLLIDRFGWQGGYWGLALIPLLIGLPIALFGIRMPDDTPARATRTQPAGAALPGMSLREAMGTRSFWVMMAIVLLMSTTLQGLGIHTVPLLSDYQLTASWIAIILALDQILGIAARVGAGFLFDKVFAPRVSIMIFGLAAIASFGLAGIPGLTVAILATLLITVGSGAESDFVGYCVGRYFGLRCYGQIFGTIYAMFMVGIALGPFLFGVAFDHFGDYRIPFALAGVGLTMLCILLLFLPRFPEETAAEKAA
jgi:MFS family permease